MTDISFKDWRVSQKYIRVYHNKTVKVYFDSLEDKNTTKLNNLKNSVLIYKKDTATQIATKIKFFEAYITNYAAITPVVPEWWKLEKERMYLN